MSAKVPFKFEEFYEAFGKSVSVDVVYVDGQVHIVRREKEPPAVRTDISQKSADPQPVSPAIDAEGPIRKHAKGRLLDSADRRRLPWSIRALLEAQEPDGSWFYSSSFEFIINGVAPPPMEGISGKLWATAIAITVWRQFPEYFELLETNYEKASLHADENVLRIVRSVLQFDALDQIRPYKSDEARAIREQLAREAAAKRDLELDEELNIARIREEEVRIGKLSLVHARRLPMPTQQLLVAELGNEFTKVFSALPPASTREADSQTLTYTKFKVGELVESCRRRRTNGSVLVAASLPPRWHLCRIAAIDEESRLLQLDFLDGDCERERRVPMKHVRVTPAGPQEARVAQFETLRSSWSQPVVCKAEIARLEEARANKLKPLPWDDRHQLLLQVHKGDEDEVLGRSRAIITPTSGQRPRSSLRRPASRPASRDLTREDPNRSADTLFQAAMVLLLQYDRAYAGVQVAAQNGARRFATALLYRERFHAFDELADSLIALMERTVDALDAIWRWKEGSPNATGSARRTFVWKGDDFVDALVRSLDFLGGYGELVAWYGEEFPLDGNPFMRSASLLEKAEQRGLRPSSRQAPGTLRAALKLHGSLDDDDPVSAAPTWWPEARYSSELLCRIEQAEEAVLASLHSSW